MTKPAFTQRDVFKAVAGAREAGLEIGRIEIDHHTGRIVILPVGVVVVQGDALDDELRDWRAEHGEG